MHAIIIDKEALLRNTISSGFGHARLVNVLAKLYGDVYGVKIDPMNEVFSEELVKFPNDSIAQNLI